MSEIPSIQITALQKLTDEKQLQLLDVRTPAEFREVHARGARNIPLDILEPNSLAANGTFSTTEPLYVICKGGGRGKTACQKLLAAGQTNIYNIEGGTLAWEAAGLPVTRGKEVISLERQVRIVAGALVLLGAVLALTLHSAFALLSAFVGAGLIFAGVTDTCGMGMMLGKMPWNQ